MKREAFLTQAEAADRLGLTARWVRELVKQGLPVERNGRRVRYPWPQVREWYNAHLERLIEERLAPSDLKEERAALTRVQRRLAELDLAKRQGELIDVETAATEVARLVDYVRARLLNLPGRLGPSILGLKTIGEAVAAIEVNVRELLEDLSTGTDELEDESDEGPPKRAKRAKATRRRTRTRKTRTAA